MDRRLRQELKSLNCYLKSAGASETSTLEFEFAGSASNASRSSSYLRRVEEQKRLESEQATLLQEEELRQHNKNTKLH